MATRAQTPRVLISSSQKSLRVPRKRIAELAAFVARAEGVRVAEIDLAVVESDEIARLHRRYLGRGGVTDVLSFDLSDSSSGGLYAQIVACGDVAAREGRLRGVGPQRELMLYVVHGLLHVMGYDDDTDSAAAEMHAREQQLLEAFRSKRAGGP